MENIIETKNLTKHFGTFKAADDISLSVKKGEIFGFLGLNGAGKTTTIRMLLGMIRPTSGESFLNGQRVYANNCALWKHVGSLVEIPYSHPELTVYENLEIIRRLRFIADAGAIERVMEKLHLGQYSDRKAKHLSLGNAQRLGLAKAIIHDPDILILDEPANGLDPAGIVEIRELILDLANNHGTTVFISSHILGEISKFATRIGIIHEGRLIQELNTDTLETLRKKRLLVDVRDRERTVSFLVKQGFEVTAVDDDLLEIIGKDSLDCPEKVNALLVNSGNSPAMLKVEVEDLETYFLRTIGKN
ncbi:MAG TPA: ABC transporter ATP-binding protein [Chitinivibrionales bacterium]|jgi:ABC-2 type transport system ATP-binding protein|nr:ABC transporter ATP-binding protein [Chitinivibrionales bacterium]